MVALLQIIQVIGLLIIINTMFYIGSRRVSKESLALELMLFAVLFSSLAFLMQVKATNYDEAIACLKLVYLGKAYIGFLYYLFYTAYMQKKINAKKMYVMLVFHTMIYMLVLLGTRTTLFFRDITFVQKASGYNYLKIENGIFYYIHMLVIYIYVGMMFYTAAKHYKENKKDKKSKMIIWLMITGGVALTGAVVHLIGLDREYELTTVMLELGTATFSLVVMKNRAFETIEIAKDNVIENLADGIIVLNSDFDILYYNSEAKKIFPEVSDIDSKDAGIIKEFCKFMATSYDKNGSYYDVQIKELISNNMVTGYTVSMVDITIHMEYSKKLENEVEEKARKISDIQERFIVSFANMIELRDDVTGQHVKRTSKYVEIIARGLKDRNIYPGVITDDFVKAICKAAPLHDIGKIAITDSILRKPGKLTDDEFEIIKTHPKVGGDMLKEALELDDADEYLYYAYEMAMYHHEKWNGTGYPNGIKGNAIPLSARIMAIADVFDALTSKRSYKDKISDERAFEIIEQSKGTHFDPILVNVFMEIKEEIIEAKNKSFE